jgi:hypothetical protein
VHQMRSLQEQKQQHRWRGQSPLAAAGAATTAVSAKLWGKTPNPIILPLAHLKMIDFSIIGAPNERSRTRL